MIYVWVVLIAAAIFIVDMIIDNSCTGKDRSGKKAGIWMVIIFFGIAIWIFIRSRS